MIQFLKKTEEKRLVRATILVFTQFSDINTKE